MEKLFKASENCWLEEFEKYLPIQPQTVAVRSRDSFLSYINLYNSAQSFANYLTSVGVKEGDYVVCFASTEIYFVVAYMATLYARAVFVPLEKGMKPNTYAKILSDLKTVKVIIGQQNHSVNGVTFINQADLPQLAKYPIHQKFPVPPRNIVSHVLFTTGSTGTCKGVVTTNAQFCFAPTMAPQAKYSENMIFYNFAPGNHFGFFMQNVCVWGLGGTVFMSQGLVEIADFFNALDKYGVNSISCPASVLNYLLSFAEDKTKKMAKQITSITLAGEPTNSVLQTKICNIFYNATLVLLYGSTEIGPVCYYNVNRHGANEGCVGLEADKVKVSFLPVEDGEDMQRLVVSTPYGMVEYLNEPELTKKFLVNGLYYTDDYGYEKDGLFYVSGRITSVIISGGKKIDPAEVEKAALLYQGVAEAVCVAQKHSVLGKVAKLIISLKLESEINMPAFRKHLKLHLEPYKMPLEIEVVQEIRKNANGKTDKKFYMEKA